MCGETAIGKSMDFNKDFEKYLTRSYREYAGKSADAAEDLAADVYAAWANEPNTALGGISPRAYFAALTDAQELVGMFCEAYTAKQTPCPLLLDRMAEVDGCAERLKRLTAQTGLPDALKTAAVSFLREHGITPPTADYVRILMDPLSNVELCNVCVEALCDVAGEAAPLLWEAADRAEETQKAYCAEVLLCAPQDERTYRLLTSLFESGRDIPLYAWYLGKYGDERAAALLYKQLETCTYIEYVEIRNAIERMGGYVEDMRDFSLDGDYKKMNG